MVDDLIASPWAFWALAVLIVVADGAFYLRPGEFTFRIHKGLRVSIRAGIPFQLAGREPVPTLFIYLRTPMFMSALGVPRQQRADVRDGLLTLKRLIRASVPLACASMCGVALLWTGPLVSLHYGVEASIVWLMPIFYLLAGIAIALLWCRRVSLNLRPGQAVRMSVLLAICPILVCNIRKTAIAESSVTLNSLDLVEFFGDDKTAALARIRDHMEVTGLASSRRPMRPG